MERGRELTLTPWTWALATSPHSNLIVTLRGRVNEYMRQNPCQPQDAMIYYQLLHTHRSPMAVKKPGPKEVRLFDEAHLSRADI